jgi:predicted NBD/HSP70 family sugar kinase
MKRIDFTNNQVASSETTRGINRGVVLNLIRRRQPISRADLARISGLQRSTVSLITEQLIQERWVVYGPTGRLPRGRRPTFLRLNDRRAILVADVRPNQTTVAAADVNGRFLSQEAMPTPPDAATAADNLTARFQHLMKIHSHLIFEGIGISVPGRFDERTQRVVFAPNLKWSDFDLKGPIARATGMRVEVENAANACVLDEVWFRQTETVRDLVFVTVSEGIGTGIFSNGQLVRGLNGMAGEFGHATLDPSGPLCGCGGRGCWEVYASNKAALRYYHESSSAASDLTFQELLALADSGHAQALKALDRMAHALGKGMRLIVAGLAPEEIVVVGEFAGQWQRFGRVIEAEVAAATLVGNPPRVRPADNPGMARLRGTIALVLTRHFGPSGTAAAVVEAHEPSPRLSDGATRSDTGLRRHGMARRGVINS